VTAVLAVPAAGEPDSEEPAADNPLTTKEGWRRFVDTEPSPPVLLDATALASLAHNDTYSAAPKTRAKPSRIRASGRGSLSRRAVPDSKKRICHKRAPAMASSNAMTDWKYCTGTLMPPQFLI